jgi:hypothetical protein
MNELKSQLVLAKSKDGKYIMLGETKETGSWFSFPKDNNTSSQFEKGDRVNVAFKVNGTFKNITSIDKAGQQSAPAYTPKSYPKAEEQWLPDPAPAAVSAYGTVKQPDNPPHYLHYLSTYRNSMRGQNLEKVKEDLHQQALVSL